MNLRYRLAAWLLGYPPMMDPDYSEAYRTIRRPHSWLLMRSLGSTSSTAAWLRIAEIHLETETQLDLPKYGREKKTYTPSQRKGTFSGTLG